MKVITPDMAGCWFAGASSRTADELCVAVIHAALEYGWAPDDKADLETLSVDGWFESGEESAFVSDDATRAEDYLNSIAPKGYSFGFDEGFYLLPVCAWEWYERSMEPCPHGEDCPNV